MDTPTSHREHYGVRVTKMTVARDDAGCFVDVGDMFDCEAFEVLDPWLQM